MKLSREHGCEVLSLLHYRSKKDLLIVGNTIVGQGILDCVSIEGAEYEELLSVDVTNCFKFPLWLFHNDRLATSNCQPNEPLLPGNCFCRGVSPEATGNRHGPVCVVVSEHARRGQKTALGYWFFPPVVGCKNRTQGIRLAQQVFLPAGPSCWPSCCLNLVTQLFSRSFVDGKIVYQKADLPAPQTHSLYL